MQAGFAARARVAPSVVDSIAQSLQLSATTSEVSMKFALHVIEVNAAAAAAEHVLHTPMSTATQGASHLSAAPPFVSKKLALHVIEEHEIAAAVEHTLHTPSSTAPQRPSQLPAVTSLGSTKLALHLTKRHALQPPLTTCGPRRRLTTCPRLPPAVTPLESKTLALHVNRGCTSSKCPQPQMSRS